MIHRHGTWAELSLDVAYELLKLRVDVFVVEQSCSYPELDGRDREEATIHWWIEGTDGTPVAYLRVLDDSVGRRIGRVVTANAARGRGLAGSLLTAVIDQEPTDLVLDAQTYLQGWYRTFGFEATGPEFVEDGIPHVPMIRSRRPASDGSPDHTAREAPHQVPPQSADRPRPGVADGPA